MSLETLDLQIRAVERGREIARSEGKRLIAKHLEEAREEIEAEEDEALGEITTDESGSATLTDKAKEVVRTRGGVHIVLPESAISSSTLPQNGEAEDAEEDEPDDVRDAVDEVVRDAALPFLPGRVVAPYDEDLHDLEDLYDLAEHPPARTEALQRVDLDVVAEFVWPVLTPDAWEPARTWELPDGAVPATFWPDRLGAPSAPVSVDKKFEKVKDRVAHARSATVLVAPGVDLLAPDLPERIAREVIEAAGTDPARRYFFLTAHPERATSFDWPSNAFVCVTAHDAASAGTIAETVAAVREETDVRFVLVLRGADEALPVTSLVPYAGVLLRGKTAQEAYDSVFAVVPYERVHTGSKVESRPLGFPELGGATSQTDSGDEPDEKRRERRAVAVKVQRDPEKGVLRPPMPSGPPSATN